METEFLLYRSRASEVVTQRLLSKILVASVQNNARDGLTGFLHAEQDVFVQYIEGPKGALMCRMRRILDDPRHREIVVLGQGVTARRLFPEWEMGLLDSPVVPRAEGQRYADWLRGFEELTRDELLQALAEQGGQVRRLDVTEVRVA